MSLDSCQLSFDIVGFKETSLLAKIIVRRKGLLIPSNGRIFIQPSLYYSRKMLRERFGVKTFKYNHSVVYVTFVNESYKNYYLMKYV